MNIAIIGSTGSIGRNALDVIKKLSHKHTVYALTGKTNINLLCRQISSCRPKIVCVHDAASAEQVKKKLGFKARRITIYHGIEGLKAVAGHPRIDFVLIALVGAVGVYPLLSAVRHKKKIALANKESLVMAGDLVMREARKKHVDIIPVDSEHSAIFQCINRGNGNEIKRLILTASGGPFYNKENVSFKTVSVEEALAHPNWKMGKKITIDSATLMNKGLEAIEAHHLFNVPMEKIHVLIHPQSIVHSLVEFIDGSVLAQLSNPDMRLPIQYALTFPGRERGLIKELKLEEIKKLEFFEPDFSRFPCLSLAFKAGKKGGTMPVVLNAANEAAVEAFLEGLISFDAISTLVGGVMKKHRVVKKPTLDAVQSSDRWARQEVRRRIIPQ